MEVSIAVFKIGFTGTKQGMKSEQLEALEKLLAILRNRSDFLEFHHGDCKGADAQAHILAMNLGFKIVIHPPKNPKTRAFCKGHEIREEKEYSVRDHDIVDECDQLIVVPKLRKEELRSGTWATYRYAKKRNKSCTVIFPKED
jgi:hypothetical protein